MNKNEARKILKIMTTADSECGVCARELMQRFIRNFPQFLNLAEEVYREEFSYESADKIKGYEAKHFGLSNEHWKKFLEEIQ